MAQTTFQGPVRSLNGFIGQGPGTVVTLAADTTLNPATHGGRILRITNASAAITLPAVNVTADPGSSGPGSDPNNLNNQGVTYTLISGINATTNTIVTNQTDTFTGSITVANATATITGAGAGTAKNISMNGTTTGGLLGSVVRIYALTTNRYMVEGSFIGSGTVATPFS